MDLVKSIFNALSNKKKKFTYLRLCFFTFFAQTQKRRFRFVIFLSKKIFLVDLRFISWYNE